ncbi:hypothetical protein BH20ACI4_BH20ACI4_32050 [soil metagenome]
MPTVNTLKVKEESKQMQLSRQFHAMHLYRLQPADGMATDKSNRVSCSSCHKSFNPIDRETPYQTCGKCHNGLTDQKTGAVLLKPNEANCLSCHVQHPYEYNRWSDFLTEEADEVRKRVIDVQISRMNEK